MGEEWEVNEPTQSMKVWGVKIGGQEGECRSLVSSNEEADGGVM